MLRDKISLTSMSAVSIPIPMTRIRTRTMRFGPAAERGELNLLEAAAALGTCGMTVLRLIQKGTLEGRQVCKGAPWVIKASAVAALDRSVIGRRRPLTANHDQKSLEF